MALETTIAGVTALCKADTTVTATQLKAIVSELKGEGTKSIIADEPVERVLSRKQVAEILGCHRKTVTEYARRGLLTPIMTGTERKRAQGYTAKSVRAFVDGLKSA